MTGRAVFNEVFLDEAIRDAGDLIEGEGNGWAVTQTTLRDARASRRAAHRLPARRARRAACSGAGPGTRRATRRPTPS